MFVGLIFVVVNWLVDGYDIRVYLLIMIQIKFNLILSCLDYLDIYFMHPNSFDYDIVRE